MLGKVRKVTSRTLAIVSADSLKRLHKKIPASSPQSSVQSRYLVLRSEILVKRYYPLNMTAGYHSGKGLAPHLWGRRFESILSGQKTDSLIIGHWGSIVSGPL